MEITQGQQRIAWVICRRQKIVRCLLIPPFLPLSPPPECRPGLFATPSQKLVKNNQDSQIPSLFICPSLFKVYNFMQCVFFEKGIRSVQCGLG